MESAMPPRSFIRRASRLARVAGVLLLATACHREGCSSPSERQEGVAPSNAPRRAVGERFVLSLAGGPTLEIERQGDRLRLKEGPNDWGTLKLESDRVKLSQGGSETAKAKAKDDGFKVYDGD